MRVRSLEAPSRPLVLLVACDADVVRDLTDALGPGFAVTSGPASPIDAGSRPDLVVIGPGAEEGSALRLRLDEGLGDVPMLLVTEAGRRDQRARLLGPAAQDFVELPIAAAEVRARAEGLVAVKRTRELLRLVTDSEAIELEQLARAALARREALEAALAAAIRALEHCDRVSRTKTAFVRTIGHELGAPLAALREALPRIGAGTPPAQAVAAAVDWIAELCAALLEHAQTESEGPREDEER
ncbi:MAG: hypothetical protein QM820_08305 [Minicystis sp.]